jgi:hypothetical protein
MPRAFEIEQVAEFAYEQNAESERAWLSVPIFTKYQFPGLSYEDRMRSSPRHTRVSTHVNLSYRDGWPLPPGEGIRV